MAKNSTTLSKKTKVKKKTYIGMSTNTKWGSKGGGMNGSTPSKKYRKKYRGQGRRR